MSCPECGNVLLHGYNSLVCLENAGRGCLTAEAEAFGSDGLPYYAIVHHMDWKEFLNNWKEFLNDQNIMECYDMVRELGTGSFGAAWLVQQKSSRAELVIKLISLIRMSTKDQQQALNEVKILAKFKHKNIIRYKDAFIYGSNLAIVMEYADGDLKAANIFLSHGDWVKIGDFGIAKLLEGGLDKARTLVGTPYYLSPELCKLQPYDFKSDMWSLGVVLYELLALKHPFIADDFTCLIKMIVKGKYQPVSRSYGPLLQDLVLVLLEVNPDKRPSAAKLLKVPSMQRHVQSYIARAKSEQKNTHKGNRSLRNICEVVHCAGKDNVFKNMASQSASLINSPNGNDQISRKSSIVDRGLGDELIEDSGMKRVRPASCLRPRGGDGFLGRRAVSDGRVPVALGRSQSCESGLNRLAAGKQTSKASTSDKEIARQDMPSTITPPVPCTSSGKGLEKATWLSLQELNAKYHFVRKRPAEIKRTVILKTKDFDTPTSKLKGFHGSVVDSKRCKRDGADTFTVSTTKCPTSDARSAVGLHPEAIGLSASKLRTSQDSTESQMPSVEKDSTPKPGTGSRTDNDARSRSRNVLVSCSEKVKARIASRVRAPQFKSEADNACHPPSASTKAGDDSVFMQSLDPAVPLQERPISPYFEYSTDLVLDCAKHVDHALPLHSTLNDCIPAPCFKADLCAKVSLRPVEPKVEARSAKNVRAELVGKLGEEKFISIYSSLRKLKLPRDSLEGLVIAGESVTDSSCVLTEFLRLILLDV